MRRQNWLDCSSENQLVSGSNCLPLVNGSFSILVTMSDLEGLLRNIADSWSRTSIPEVWNRGEMGGERNTVPLVVFFRWWKPPHSSSQLWSPPSSMGGGRTREASNVLLLTSLTSRGRWGPQSWTWSGSHPSPFTVYTVITSFSSGRWMISFPGRFLCK